MPIFFQHTVNADTRLGIWKIEETEEFFKHNVPLHRDVTHPHKRLQHLAGRFLLQYLFPDFPYDLIRIADTRRPYLENEAYHFSISHCGDFAAAIVSRTSRVGIDIEIPVNRMLGIRDKFLNEEERKIWDTDSIDDLTLLWSSKEAVFKWYGLGGVDFSEQIRLNRQHEGAALIDSHFTKSGQDLSIHYRLFGHLVLAWVSSHA